MNFTILVLTTQEIRTTVLPTFRGLERPKLRKEISLRNATSHDAHGHSMVDEVEHFSAIGNMTVRQCDCLIETERVMPLVSGSIIVLCYSKRQTLCL